MSREQVRERYELAGRAVHAFLTDWPSVPSTFEGTNAAASLNRARESARTMFGVYQEQWRAAMPTRDLEEQTAAANGMEQLARMVARVLRSVERAEDMSGSMLSQWRRWWRSSPVGLAKRAFDAYMRGLDRILDVAPETAAAAGGGAAIAIILAGGIALWVLSR